MRTTADHLSFFERLAAEPHRFDFFQTLRQIECLHADKPRLGAALRPADEPLRLGQAPALDFAPAAISALRPGKEGKPPRLEVRFFGLFGPNGPLPLQLTDYARERILHGGDETFARFADLFHHRLLLLFYRAWAHAQPTVNQDRPTEDRFAERLGSLIGIGSRHFRGRDEVSEYAKLYFAGLLVRQIRHGDGLQALLSGFFRVPLKVEQFTGHWMTLPESERTRLGGRNAGAQLGVGTVIGSRVWDRQHKFRLCIGPLGLEKFESFLPGGKGIAALVALVRQYLSFELEWDAILVLKRDEVPVTRLGKYGRLGWTTWLGKRTGAGDAEDLTLDPERLLARGSGAGPLEPSMAAAGV